MTDLLGALALLPGETKVTITVSVDELRDALNHRNPLRVLTTGEAAKELGYSGDTWRAWAEAGRIDGAYRDDGDDGMWRLPLGACEEHLERLKAGTLNRRRKRGPWAKEAPSAPTGGAGPEDLPEGKVVDLRSAAMGRRQGDDEAPGSAGLAGPRGTDRSRGRS